MGNAADEAIRQNIVETGRVPSVITVSRSDFADLLLTNSLDCIDGLVFVYRGIIVKGGPSGASS